MSALSNLPAQVRPDCRVLVLGSMPGAVSLAEARYYAHPRNRFWPLMGRLCGFDPAQDYAARLHCLQEAGIGLWDVLARCRRQGSLDAAIEKGSEEVIPLGEWLPRWPALAGIACNGGTAGRLFHRHLLPAVHAWRPGLPVWVLPSTSPANASRDLAALEAHWRVIVPLLAGGNAAPAQKNP